jgi:hypothetical protein
MDIGKGWNFPFMLYSILIQLKSEIAKNGHFKQIWKIAKTRIYGSAYAK